ncbi:MAG: UDP-3-O-(3-hydroxymyristoyl)glucosamine N-acyltransferase, partial [Comamonas sp.]
HESAYVGPLCVVEANARIGAGTVLKSRVTLGEGCEVGERCILHPGVVIGADGFGFAPSKGAWIKIEQLGRVRVGNDVEIGANTCVDRGALDDTVIEDGVKIDNLVQIAHNVHIGAHTVIAGNTGIAGSARIGAHCQIGGAANILGHLTIADGTVISPTSMVTRSLPKPGFYTGIFPLQENEHWEKNAATFKQLYVLRERIKKLEQTLANDQRSNNGN